MFFKKRIKKHVHMHLWMKIYGTISFNLFKNPHNSFVNATFKVEYDFFLCKVLHLCFAYQRNLTRIAIRIHDLIMHCLTMRAKRLIWPTHQSAKRDRGLELGQEEVDIFLSYRVIINQGFTGR